MRRLLVVVLLCFSLPALADLFKCRYIFDDEHLIEGSLGEFLNGVEYDSHEDGFVMVQTGTASPLNELATELWEKLEISLILTDRLSAIDEELLEPHDYVVWWPELLLEMLAQGQKDRARQIILQDFFSAQQPDIVSLDLRRVSH